MSEQNINIEFQISSLEEYQKATEMLHNNIVDVYSDEGKRMKKIVDEINRFHLNNFEQKSNIKKSII